MRKLLRWLVMAPGVIAALGSALSLSRSPHSLVRVWDFPRVQLAAAAAISAGLFRACFFRRRRTDWLFLAGTVATVLWHARRILPFTRLSRQQVKWSTNGHPPERCVRLLIANVLMENREHERLLALVEECDPDVVLVVETDAVWEHALRPLRQRYPHRAGRSQENYYGMLLFSRLPLVAPKVEFLIQADIPSIHTGLELPSGERVWLHGLHPRPPEPIRDQDSKPRDAELVLVGRGIGEAIPRPTIVAGDLNDVAWSPTTELFLRLSKLLDPRVGRGFFNTFHADHWLVRYPLDHVFHSQDFQLFELRRLAHIGSDHFPVLIGLCYAPERAPEQPTPQADAGDQREADEKLARQAGEPRQG